MPAVPQSERKRRAAALREAGNVALNRFLETQVGSKIEVLVERSCRGLSRHYAVCELDVDGEPGAVVSARATAVANGVLKGSAIV